MGKNHSKIENNDIYIITYNCQIKYFSNYKSNRLLNYILNFKNNNFVLCLQGLYDNKTLTYIEDNIEKINIIKPDHENGLVVFSTYDIIYPEHILFEIIENNIFKGNKGFTSFNIGINNNLISIYNTELQEDIHNNLCLNNIRLKQISEILVFIAKKKKEETHLKLHIIVGALYMNHIKSSKLHDVMSLFQKNIITNIDTNVRDDYIIFFTEINYNIKELINYMYDTYKIKIMNIIIREEMNFAKNLPCEIILRIDT
jgi:hypothetical protein